MMKFVKIFAFLILAVAGVHAASTEAVVLVSDNPADLAVAQLLAQKINATVVVTPWGTLSAEAVAQIEQSGVNIVYVIGGPVAVPDAEVKINVTVKRLAGRDRYETAAMVAELWNVSSEVIIVHGFDEDGIKEAMEKARRLGIPLLLVKEDEVPEEVERTLEKLRFRRAVMVPAPDMDPNTIRERLRVHGIEEVEEVQIDFAERAYKAILKAEEEITEAETLLGNITSGREVAAARLIANAKRHLFIAKDAYNQSNYGEAFGLAVAAKEEAKAAKKILENVVVGEYEIEVEEAEIEIERHGLEKVKMEVEMEIHREEAREKERERAERAYEYSAEAGKQEDSGEYEVEVNKSYEWEEEREEHKKW